LQFFLKQYQARSDPGFAVLLGFLSVFVFERVIFVGHDVVKCMDHAGNKQPLF
jgi:hypothetical protein